MLTPASKGELLTESRSPPPHPTLSPDAGERASLLPLPLGEARGEGRRVIPYMEAALFLAFALAPLVLADYLTVFAGRVLILAMLAISFDLVFGFAGMMSFGQALFFGSA